MSFLIQRITNKPVESNCYVIHNTYSSECLVIDPGEETGEYLSGFLKAGNLCPGHVLVTHEHFDHVWGVNRLKEEYGSIVICSSWCSGKITAPKGNLSVFYDQTGFTTIPADQTVEQLDFRLDWLGHEVRFILTPGHTGGCVTISIGNNLFTGDFLIKGVKTNTKLPGSSVNELNNSLEKILKLFEYQNPMVYPGHGERFPFSEVIPEMRSIILTS